MGNSSVQLWLETWKRRALVLGQEIGDGDEKGYGRVW